MRKGIARVIHAPLTRRGLLATGVAGAASLALAAGPVAADEPTMGTIALDPTGGSGKCRSNCAACSACIAHAANKLFSTKQAAESFRAHKGCRCTLVEGQSLSEAVYKQLFANGDVADRRHTDTIKLLGAQVEQHSVPMVAGVVPAAVLAVGAAGILWEMHRRFAPTNEVVLTALDPIGHSDR